MLRIKFTTLRRWVATPLDLLRRYGRRLRASRRPLTAAASPLQQWSRGESVSLPAFVQESSVALHYLAWLGRLDWSHFPERPACNTQGQGWRGPSPEASAPYVAALLIKVDRHFAHMAALRQFLVEHPALIWVLGFPLAPDARYRWGFDVEATLPTHHHFTRRLRQLPNEALQFLLSSTVTLIEAALPQTVNFGDEISLDTKHILAWVRENNPKEFIQGGRFHKEQQPKGDKDCKVGFKANSNQVKGKAPAPPADDTPTPTSEAIPGSHAQPGGDYLWGYASGVVATKVADWGEFVLAELTQPFDQSEVSYFFPLLAMVEHRLGKRPRFAALDAAFDAFYVYEYFHPTEPGAPGFAAIPLRFEEIRHFDPTGLPLCEAGLAMPLKSTYMDRTHLFVHQRGRYACPLLYPSPTAAACPIAHARWEKGGCVTTMATSIGARLRYQLDRRSAAYQRIYQQRTATERVNSQAVALGIERPHLRNQRSIANQNTLIYIVINLRALDRVTDSKQQRITMM